MMKSKWFELVICTALLWLGFVVRIHDITLIPAGFSEDEITSIRITYLVRDGTFRVFFNTGEGGTEGFYSWIQAGITFFIGDGLLGYRMLSIWGSLVTLAAVYAVARRLFGMSIGFIALGTMCFGIWPVIAGRSVGAVSLVGLVTLLTLLVTSYAYYLQRTIRPLPPKTLPYTFLAFTITFAAYTFYTGLLAGIGVLLFVFYLRYTRQPVSRNIWWNSGYALALAVILALPYIISFLRTPSLSGVYILWRERPESPFDLLDSLRRTLLAFFWKGDSDPAHNVPGLPLIFSLEGVVLAIGLGVSIVRWRQPNYGLLLIFFLLGLIPDIWLDEGPQYPALSFASPLAYILIGIGVIEILRILQNSFELPERLVWLREQQWMGTWPQPLVSLVVLLFALTVARNLWIFRQNVFVEWPARSDTQTVYHTALGNFAIYLDRHHDGPPVLLCSAQISSTNIEDVHQPITDQQLLEWMMHYDDLAFRVANCQRDFVLINGGEAMRVLFTTSASLETMPAELREWLTYPTGQRQRIPELERGTAYLLNAEQALADRGGLLQLDSVMFYPREGADTPQDAPQPTRFGGNMTFMGHDPLNIADSLHPNDAITLVTYWRIDGPLLKNTGVFIRLHDNVQASPYTEINLFDVDTTRLKPRDVVIQIGYLILPDRLRSQTYRLTIGVYDSNPVNQLPVYDVETGVIRGSYLLLGEPFMVVSPTEN